MKGDKLILGSMMGAASLIAVTIVIGLIRMVFYAGTTTILVNNVVGVLLLLSFFFMFVALGTMVWILLTEDI